MTKTEQILETVRELREARSKAVNGEWYKSANAIKCRRDLFVAMAADKYEPGLQDANAEFIVLAANKMDQLCEALFMYVEAVEYLKPILHGEELQFVEETIEKAAEILGRDKR